MRGTALARIKDEHLPPVTVVTPAGPVEARWRTLDTAGDVAVNPDAGDAIRLRLDLGAASPLTALSEGDGLAIDLIEGAERLRDDFRLAIVFRAADGTVVDSLVKPVGPRRPLLRFKVPAGAAMAEVEARLTEPEAFGPLRLGLDAGATGALDVVGAAINARDAEMAETALAAARACLPHHPALARAEARLAAFWLDLERPDRPEDDDAEIESRPRVPVGAAVQASGFYDVEYEGMTIPVRFRRAERPSNALIVLFHGALQREKRGYPYFAAFLPDMPAAHQLSIADTTLAADGTASAGWYLGAEAAPLQEILPRLITHVRRLLGATRRIYVGGSSGGFAALFYSWHDHRSVAVVANPQISLPDYIPEPVEQIRAAAWPGAPDLEALGRRVCLDVSQLYARGQTNRVVYVQSRGDRRHMSTQFPTFMRAVDAKAQRVILDVGYWGIPGHSGSVPPAAYLPWVRAVLGAPSLLPSDVIQTHHRVLAGQGGARPGGGRGAPLASDVDTADRLARIVLAEEQAP